MVGMEMGRGKDSTILAAAVEREIQCVASVWAVQLNDAIEHQSLVCATEVWKLCFRRCTSCCVLSTMFQRLMRMEGIKIWICSSRGWTRNNTYLCMYCMQNHQVSFRIWHCGIAVHRVPHSMGTHRERYLCVDTKIKIESVLMLGIVATHLTHSKMLTTTLVRRLDLEFDFLREIPYSYRASERASERIKLNQISFMCLCVVWHLTVECTHNFPNPTDRCSFGNWYWLNDGSTIGVVVVQAHHVHMYRMPSNKSSRYHDGIELAYAMSVIDTSFCWWFIFVSPFLCLCYADDDDWRRFSEFTTRNCEAKMKNH